MGIRQMEQSGGGEQMNGYNGLMNINILHNSIYKIRKMRERRYGIPNCLSVVLMMMMKIQISDTLNGCQTTNGFFNCGIDWNYGQCYEWNDGSFMGCTNSNGVPQYQLANNADTYNTNRCGSRSCYCCDWCCDCCCCYNNYQYINIAVYRKCGTGCASCDGQGNPESHCQTCLNNYWKWYGLDRCKDFCPSVYISTAVSSYGYGYNSVGQFKIGSNLCDICDSRCNFCDGTANTNCYSCVSGYRLIDDQSVCASRFSSVGYSNQSMCYPRQCQNSGVNNGCPTDYYFYVTQSTVNSTYNSWAIGASVSNNDISPTSYNYRKMNNDGVCYLCNEHCQTCDGPNQNNCLTCSRFNYMWSQRANYCRETCPRGTYGAGWFGEFINETDANTATGIGGRKCYNCTASCRWCRGAADYCLQCRNNYFLMDFYDLCMTRYINPTSSLLNCTECATYNTCGTSNATADKKCVSNCPTYFYFPLYRTYPATNYSSVLFARYKNYTNITAASEIVVNGTDNYATTTEAYRQGTNLCMLCDYRCIMCDGPYNTNCSKCRNWFYKWVGYSVCQDYCPIGQYIALDHAYPADQTECATCDSLCVSCQKKVLNCSSCVGAGYAFWSGGNVAFLYSYNDSYSICNKTCPNVNTDYSVSIGYYGSYVTLNCYPCPSPCSRCDINLITRDYPDISCNDSYCTNGIVCTQCLSGYVVVGGKCIAQNNCREYAQYVPPAVSTSWSAVNCKCLEGYSSTSFAKCNLKCDISCKTCVGNSSANCSSCYNGYDLVSKVCVFNNVKALNTFSWRAGQSLTSLQVTSSITPTTYDCGPYFTSLWGWEDQDNDAATNTVSTSKSFGYPFTISGLSYYAIHFKIGLLFVDEFNSRGAIYLRRGTNTSSPIWTWNYNTKNAYGEQRCGSNKMDYILYLTGQIPSFNTTTEKFFFTSNQNLIQNTLMSQLHWGIESVMITVLSCHSDCSRCTGPTNTDCLVCATAGYIAVNKTCVCNVDSNYYLQPDGTCGIGCPANDGWFMDKPTRSCVQPIASNCTAPKRFGDSMGTTGYGTCVADCPTGYYASMKIMKCTQNCWTGGPNQYKFSSGASRVCVDTCPAGFIKDVLNRECVLKCPTSYYFAIQNSTTDPTCTDTCASGSWEYDDLQLCVTACPNGYFRQTASGHRKCVQVCTNSFGDPASGNCTLSCPFPTYADADVRLCVDTCGNSTRFMQVAVADANRTCVDQCQPGQYGNPFTFKCSNYTTDCPDGYFADSATWMCQQNCTHPYQVAENSTKQCRNNCLTGFAHWESQACVQICPSDPPMFGYLTDKVCVYSCNFSDLGLYGDAQANRTCVQRCSSSPTPTFGHNGSSLCVDKCPGTEFGDPADIYRRCVSSCSSLPRRYANSVTKLCVLTCPDTYFGQIDATLNSGVCVQTCRPPNYGDPQTHWCRPTCKWGYYGWPSGNRPCLKTCPRYWFGMNGTTNRVCVQICNSVSGYWGDIETSMCYNNKQLCSNDTYADAAKFLCVSATNCSVGSFADPFTKGCQATCSNGYYGDKRIRTCVAMCSDQHDEYGQWGICRSSCISNRFADPQSNRTCVRNCSRTPIALFGLIPGGSDGRTCVTAANCPPNYYGDNTTLNCVNPCSGTFPFGDPISKQCVSDCPDGYYGDKDSHLCVQMCNFATRHYADNYTGNCQTLCTLGTYGVNASATDSIPSCEEDCPPGSFARDSDRICVANCGSGLYGDPIKRKCYSNPFNCSQGYFANSISHLCVLPADCQTVGVRHYFAQNSTKTCVPKCLTPNYGDTIDWFCYPVCNQTSFGQNNTRLCKTDCSPWLSYAQTQNNLCVARCSNTPIKHYAEDVTYTCVEAKDCPVSTTQTYAQNSSQKCVRYCGAGQWADPTTLRCVAICPNGYYADNSTGQNLCSTSCPQYYRFRDNSTRRCVPICPASNSTFGDSDGDACVYRCPVGTFAQVDSLRRCVPTCKDGTWGNKITRVCITQPATECPINTWADNFTHKCEEVCDANSGYYGYNVTRMCVVNCPWPGYAWDGTRVCIDVCPASLVDSGYFGDNSTTPARRCVRTCQTAGYYRDVAISRTCVLSCRYNSTYKTYKDPTTMSCESVCSTYPQMRYINDALRSCETSCAGSLRKNDANQSCVATCPYLYNPTTDKCVDICPTQSTLGPLFANLTNNNNTCIVATSCPNNTWADTDSRTCASSCPLGTFKYGKYCLYDCPYNYFMDNATQSCVLAVNCSPGLVGDNQTRSCVSQCIGTYLETTLNRCIDVCYGTKYGDPFTHRCETNCSQGLRMNAATRTCQANCVIGLYSNPATNTCSSSCSSPYYADNSTMACVTSCSANPMTFASVSSTGARQCVGRCDVTKMHDMVNRICVNLTACPANTYSYSVNMSCVSFCPAPSYYRLGTACVLNCSSHATLKYADDLSRTCVRNCPTGTYKDNLTYKCVEVCPSAPVQYYISVSQGNCTTFCPEGTYGDPQQLLCVASCSLSPPMYAEEVTNMCVQTCPLAQRSFADSTTGKCVTSCPQGYFADSRDRKCKQNCSFLFADSSVVPRACVANCSTGLFADELTYRCVSDCPANYYKHIPTKQCVKSCPYGYYLNTVQSLCVVKANCTVTIPYADNLTRTCVSNCSNGQFGYLALGRTTGGECRYYCPANFFSNPRTGKCVSACPEGLYADTDNRTCMEYCTYEKFMDPVNNKCVTKCPALYNLYADLYNRTCVTYCDPATFTFADDLTQQCEETCTGDQYADNDTQKCVGPAQCSGNLFSDPHMKKCVQICYNGTYGFQGKCIPDCPTEDDDVYASQDGFICVTAENCPNGTYGDPVLHKCVEFCPISSGTFADDETRKCLFECNSPLFADNLTRTCVEYCPNVSKMYGDASTHRCVLNCPYPTFADETTNLCQQGCPDGYYTDLPTLTCVQNCPEGKFENNVTNECVDTCPARPDPYFGDPETRSCVFYCPVGKFADPDNNRQCHPKCLGNIDTYAENSTGECLETCLTGFANERTKQCIAVCSAGFFGYNKVCYRECPSVYPTIFADNQTHLCVESCPNGTFADYSTLKCVHICPINDSTFGDANSWTCTNQCPGGYYADPSTRMCVETCPQTPALFGMLPDKVCISQCTFGFYADNATRRCLIGCPDGTYADNTTMRCQLTCPTHPLMFGLNETNKCVKRCPTDRRMFADNATRTCVYYCSPNSYAYYNTTFRGCVKTCPRNYYAVNATATRHRTCELGCSSGQFADPLLRICVERCSVDPIYYGDPNDHFCKEECPSGSYGNPLTQQCVSNHLSGISNCPPNYYGDSNSHLCVQVCPKKRNLYGDPYWGKCRTTCSGDLIADNSTMRCVQTCPEYPSYFADLTNTAFKKCVPFCPNGTYADPISRVCVIDCPNNTYGDNSTWRCVEQCPQSPLTFGYSGSWVCLDTCPDETYADPSTLRCVTRCPADEKTYAENTTKTCVRVCPEFSFADEESGYCVLQCYGDRFSDNSSRVCVEECPKYPASYADSTTGMCVEDCPQFYYSYEQNRTCILECPINEGLYRQISTSSCVSKCRYQENTYADNETGFCVDRCSLDSWADPTIRVCVAVCPDQPLMYADNISQACVARCPGSTFGQNSTRTCVDSCPTGSLSLPQNNLCVRYCPIGYFAYNLTAFCYDICPGDYFGDPSTRSCVLTCPLNQLLFADISSKRCVKTCPSGSYADKKSVYCVSTCPDANATLQEAQTYAADYNNVCVQQCSLPYYAYLPTKRCVTICPNPYYNNIQDHLCKICPSVCTSCTTYDVCTTCLSNRYLENGKCVLVCSNGYYANSGTMRCVSSALCRPNYGINSTHTCSPSCPDGTFKNNRVYRCDACQLPCLTCTAWTTCQTCDTNVSVMYQNFCYYYCEYNDTNSNGVIQPYFSPDNTTCYDACPNGTYLFVIFCKNCSSSCQTCVGTKTNCTRCANGLYLQNRVCVTQCSTGFKPVVSRDCIYCGSNCSTALTFDTNVTQINGQNTVFINFSENITLNGDPNAIFGLSFNSRRRLLANGYTIVVIDSRTIQIILDNSVDVSSFTVNINQPENIQDIYGNLPVKVRDAIEFDMSNTYTTSLNSAPSGFSTYFTIFAVVCVFSFFFDIEFMKFMQLIFVHYFVVMILPPQLSKVLLAFRFSTLSYLPAMYPIPTAVLRNTVSGKLFDAIGDFSFLRNGGFALTPLAVIIILWIIIKLLSIPEINRFKEFRIWCKSQLEEKFKFAIQVEWLSIVYLNTIFFIFMQMRDYNKYDSFSEASIIFAHIMLVLIGLMFFYLVYRVISFFREYPKLSENLKKATDILLQENEYHKLNSSNIFLFEMKKIDLRNLYYPKINNENILPFRNIYKFGFLPLCCILVNYLRATILSLILAFGSSTLLQMSLCIVLNVACLLYFSRARPFSFKFKKRRLRNYIAIFHEVALIIFEFLLLVLGIMDRDMRPSIEKETFSNGIIYYLCIVCTVSFIYFVFRIGVQIYRRIWMPFTATQIFKNNFPEKYAEIHGQKKQKFLRGVDPKAKQALRALIKGYKKNRSSLRPTEEDKANPQLPIKYKITYFDRDSSSVGTKSSMSKSQKRKMLNDIFQGDESQKMKYSKAQKQGEQAQFEQLERASEGTEAEYEYEEYEEEIEIKAKDLAKYVKNAEQLLRLKRQKEDEKSQV